MTSRRPSRSSGVLPPRGTTSSSDRGHGRIEHHEIRPSLDVAGDLEFPHAGVVLASCTRPRQPGHAEGRELPMRRSVSRSGDHETPAGGIRHRGVITVRRLGQQRAGSRLPRQRIVVARHSMARSDSRIPRRREPGDGRRVPFHARPRTRVDRRRARRPSRRPRRRTESRRQERARRLLGAHDPEVPRRSPRERRDGEAPRERHAEAVPHRPAVPCGRNGERAAARRSTGWTASPTSPCASHGAGCRDRQSGGNSGAQTASKWASSCSMTAALSAMRPHSRIEPRSVWRVRPSSYGKYSEPR